jgi:hypothetical protein
MFLQMLRAVFLSLVAMDLLTAQSTDNKNSVVSVGSLSVQLCELLCSGVRELTADIEGSFEGKGNEVFVRREMRLGKSEETLGSYKNVGLDIKCDRNTSIASDSVYLCSCNMNLEVGLSHAIGMPRQPKFTGYLLNQGNVTHEKTTCNVKLNNLFIALFGNLSDSTRKPVKFLLFRHSTTIHKLTGLKDCDVIKCSLDIDNMESWPNIDADALEFILTQTKTQAYLVSDREMILVIKFILIILVTSFVGNWTILLVFLRHTEFRYDPTLIILNLTIAHVSSLIFGSVMFIFSATREHSYQPNSSNSVFILVWCVTTLISVYFVTKATTKKYFSVLSTEKFMGLFWQYRRKLWAISVYALYLLTCVSQVLVTSTYTAHVYQLVRMLALLNCTAKSQLLLIAVTTHAVARSRKRKPRRSLWASEVTYQDIKRSHSVGNIKFIFYFIIIFMTNYMPIYILDVYDEGPSIFKQISLESVSIISLLVVIINTFLNPILMYGISSAFRLAFNKLHCVNMKHGQINVI